MEKGAEKSEERIQEPRIKPVKRKTPFFHRNNYIYFFSDSKKAESVDLSFIQ